MIEYRNIQLGTKTYRVGSDGSIWNLEVNLEQNQHIIDGYKRFSYPTAIRKQKIIKVHQVVAIAFLNHTPNGMKYVVDHINGDRLDNRVENLRIVTQQENSLNKKFHRVK